MSTPVRLQTHVWNPLGEQRALLLHGLGSDGNCWWRLASQLAGRGFLVVAPDLRSHGRSPAADDHRIATMVDDVALLGEHYELVVGHSLGGTIAAVLLARTPGVTAAVLVDPVLRLTAEQRVALREEVRRDVGPLDAATLHASHPSWDERDVHRKVLAAALVAPETVDAVMDDNDPWDVVDATADWRARVHLLSADPSLGALLDPVLADEVADGQQVTAQVVHRAGHSIQRDRPDVVRAAVDRVLAAGSVDEAHERPRAQR